MFRRGPHEPLIEPLRQRSAAPVSGSRRALVIEDVQTVANLVRRALEREGFQSDVAGDGEAGLRAALVGDYDVVVLDVRLPELDGFEVVRAMRERTRRVHPPLNPTGELGHHQDRHIRLARSSSAPTPSTV